ncbi:MAG: ABC transporter permease subunit [Pseudomonadota bacterium]
MDNLLRFAPLLAEGTMVTVAVALLSLALATALGALGATGRLTGGRIAKALVWLYTGLVRGVPDLVLILLIYFGGQRLINTIGRALDLEYIEVSQFGSGVLAIGFIYGAYLTETFRGAYLTVPKGQIEAGQALGLSRLQTLWLVTMPQLMRFALPGYANVWQVLVKSTAVVSIIGLGDLVGLAGDAGKSVREPFTFYFAVFCIYLCITAISQAAFDRAERWSKKGLADAH